MRTCNLARRAHAIEVAADEQEAKCVRANDVSARRAKKRAFFNAKRGSPCIGRNL